MKPCGSCLLVKYQTYNWKIFRSWPPVHMYWWLYASGELYQKSSRLSFRLTAPYSEERKKEQPWEFTKSSAQMTVVVTRTPEKSSGVLLIFLTASDIMQIWIWARRPGKASRFADWTENLWSGKEWFMDSIITQIVCGIIAAIVVDGLKAAVRLHR